MNSYSIALFGTSADPPTQGHEAIVVYLAAQFDHVAVWVAHNPLKQHHASLEQRMAMMQLLITPLPYPNIGFYPSLSDPHTLVTVERARQQWPAADFTLVVGSDVVYQLPYWHQSQALLAQVKLLVIPRPGCPLAPDTLAALATEVKVADWQGPPGSSTASREGKDLEVLTPAIRAYARTHQLYNWPR